MKMQDILSVSIIFSFMLFLASCRDIHTTTQVLPDGSCIRTVEFMGMVEDESEIMNDIYPIPQDSSWTISYGDENHPGKSFQKKFRRVSDLNEELANKLDTLLHIRISVQLQKKFRWFNTYFKYQEVYHAADPFALVPISDFLSEEELELFYINEDTLDYNDRVEKWLAYSIVEDYFQQIKLVVDTLGHPDLSAEWLNSKKELLLEKINEGEQIDQAIQSMVKILESMLGAPAVQLLSEHISRIDADIMRKYEFLMNLGLNGGYTNQVIMPGLILDTNAEELEGNMVSWQISGNRFIWEDYSMWVESRVVNQWAMIVTGVVCICLVVGLLLGSILRRRRKAINTA